jgi:hypothetical protein
LTPGSSRMAGERAADALMEFFKPDIPHLRRSPSHVKPAAR